MQKAHRCFENEQVASKIIDQNPSFGNITNSFQLLALLAL